MAINLDEPSQNVNKNEEDKLLAKAVVQLRASCQKKETK